MPLRSPATRRQLATTTARWSGSTPPAGEEHEGGGAAFALGAHLCCASVRESCRVSTGGSTHAAQGPGHTLRPHSLCSWPRCIPPAVTGSSTTRRPQRASAAPLARTAQSAGRTCALPGEESRLGWEARGVQCSMCAITGRTHHSGDCLACAPTALPHPPTSCHCPTCSLPGYYSPAGASDCTICPLNQFSPIYGLGEPAAAALPPGKATATPSKAEGRTAAAALLFRLVLVATAAQLSAPSAPNRLLPLLQPSAQPATRSACTAPLAVWPRQRRGQWASRGPPTATHGELAAEKRGQRAASQCWWWWWWCCCCWLPVDFKCD